MVCGLMRSDSAPKSYRARRVGRCAKAPPVLGPVFRLHPRLHSAPAPRCEREFMFSYMPHSVKDLQDLLGRSAAPGQAAWNEDEARGLPYPPAAERFWDSTARVVAQWGSIPTR